MVFNCYFKNSGFYEREVKILKNHITKNKLIAIFS